MRVVSLVGVAQVYVAQSDTTFLQCDILLDGEAVRRLRSSRQRRCRELAAIHRRAMPTRSSKTVILVRGHLAMW